MILSRSRAFAAIVFFALAGDPAVCAEPPAPDVRALGGVRAEAAALLARGGEGGSLRMALAAAPLGAPAADGKIPTLLVVELDGATLVSGHPGGRLGVEIAVYALGRGGAIQASRNDGVALDIGTGEELASSGLRLLARFDLAPGEITLRAFARVRQTGAFALREARVTLPRPLPAPPRPPAQDGPGSTLSLRGSRAPSSRRSRPRAGSPPAAAARSIPRGPGRSTICSRRPPARARASSR